jgi:hypothetical protein
LPRRQEQVVALAGPLSVILAGLGEVLVEGHGLLLAAAAIGGWRRWPAAALGSTIASGLGFHHARWPTRQLT